MDAACVRFYEFGRPEDVLSIDHKKVVPPKDNEVLVRMSARPINPSDLIPIRGSYSHRISLPTIPGYEGVGVVEDVGSNVSNQHIGRRVLALRGEGTWQAYVRTSAEFAVPIPEFVDDFTAAQMYINPITAWVICTEVLKLQPNDSLLVNACGSSIGRIFAQLAKVLGFKLVAVTRNDKHSEDLLELGASHVINTSSASLTETVMELTNGRNADAAIDSIGGSAGNELAFCVRPNGNFLTVGLLSGMQVDWKEIVNKAKVNANLFHLRNWNKNVSINEWRGAFDQVTRLIEEQKLQLMAADSTYDLLDIKSAIHAVEGKKVQGKVFLTSDW